MSIQVDWEWVDRAGMLLQFVSFWMMLPELFGEERLLRLARRFVVGPFYELFPCVGVAAHFVIGCLLPQDIFGIRDGAWFVAHFVGGMIMVLLLVIMPWICNRLLRVLARNSGIRQLALGTGAAIFCVGFSLNFAASFFA